METEYTFEGSQSDGSHDELGGPDPAGWWEVIGGAWRWMTDPTPT